MLFSFASTRLTAGAFAVLLAFPALAQNVTRTQLVTASPTRVGQAVLMTAEVDALGGGAATGSVTFADNATSLGAAPLKALGAGQATLAAGYEHTCAVTNAGGVKCWERNNYGQIGDGTTTDRLLPATTTGFLGLLRARARLVTTALPAGWRLLRASYPGDATHAASSADIPHWVQ